MKHINEYAKELTKNFFGHEYDPNNEAMRSVFEAIRCGYVHATYKACEYLSKATRPACCSDGGCIDVPIFNESEIEVFKHKMLEE